MKAHVQPLDGHKYYGTSVTIEFQHPDGAWDRGSIRVWIGNGKPSEEQIKQWMAEGMIDSEGDIREMMSDGHYQSQVDADIAKTIADAINAKQGVKK